MTGIGTYQSVAAFLAPDAWGPKPWNHMNIPVGLVLDTYDGNDGNDGNDGIMCAKVIVFMPRKEYVNHIIVHIRDNDELATFRATFRGVGEVLFEPAARNLETFAAGAMPASGCGDWGGLVLYYWKPEEFGKQCSQ